MSLEGNEMVEELAGRSCIPCRSGMPPLPDSELQRYLEQTPGWVVSEGGRTIERRFRFSNFAEALDFVIRVGRLAESEGHHPDIGLGWGWATVSWQTKKIGGLHENDFIMAARTSRLAGPQSIDRQ